jgi:hypothetical protein
MNAKPQIPRFDINRSMDGRRERSDPEIFGRDLEKKVMHDCISNDGEF